MQILRGTNNLSEQDQLPDIDIDAMLSSINLPLLLMRFHNLEAHAGNFNTNFFT